MNREYIDKEFCAEIAPLIPLQVLEKILCDSSHLNLDQIISLLLQRNSDYEHTSETDSCYKVLSNDEIFTLPCANPRCCIDTCTYYHSPQEVRRPLTKYKYGKTPCRYASRNGHWDVNNCRKGENCTFAHSTNEINYYLPRRFFNNKKPIEEKIVLEEVKEVEKVEFVKFKQTSTNNISLLVDSLQMLKHEIADKTGQYLHKQNELGRLNETISEFTVKMKCAVCRTHEYEYIASPCGHSICSPCISTYKCPKCSAAIVDFIKIVV